MADTKKLEVNADLAKERQKCDFDVQEVTYLIDGGQKNTIQRKKIGKFHDIY
jgi:acyl-CoA oxidase